jgi:hypothetical protein
MAAAEDGEQDILDDLLLADDGLGEFREQDLALRGEALDGFDGDGGGGGGHDGI